MSYSIPPDNLLRVVAINVTNPAEGPWTSVVPRVEMMTRVVEVLLNKRNADGQVVWVRRTVVVTGASLQVVGRQSKSHSRGSEEDDERRGEHCD